MSDTTPTPAPPHQTPVPPKVCLMVCWAAGISAVVGFVAIVAAFWVPPATTTGFVWFMIIFAIGELAIFAGTAPVGAVM